jgi:dTDP-4-amino-4,6-dideoxygalactose transaminase
MDVLDSNRLSYGPYTSKFEKKFADAHTVKYAIMCNSGTSALRVAVACLIETENWHEGDEVLVPAVTFVATANVLIGHGLRPVFVDVDPRTYNIDPAQIERHVTPRTRAIMPVHLFGQPCDMDPILKLAEKHGLKVIEDSCETMFVRYKGRAVGSFGDIACFSTYVAHIITTGVGGLAVTNSDEYAVVLKSLMNHGRDSIYLNIDDDKTEDKSHFFKVVERRFRFVRLGYSFRATEMEGALGLGMLELKDQIMDARQHNACYLTEGLSPFSDRIQLPSHPDYVEHAYMMYPIVIKDPTVRKEELVNFLEENNIETRDMLPLLNQPIYVQLLGCMEDRYPVAKWINQCGFYVGCHQGLGHDELDYMIEKFREFLPR